MPNTVLGIVNTAVNTTGKKTHKMLLCVLYATYSLVEKVRKYVYYRHADCEKYYRDLLLKNSGGRGRRISSLRPTWAT